MLKSLDIIIMQNCVREMGMGFNGSLPSQLIDLHGQLS